METFRPQTNDHLVYQAVVDVNEYDLPDDLFGKVVVDIGMHIGSFTYACLKRKATKVYGFEPHLANFMAAVENLLPMEGAIPANLAVWRSDRTSQLLSVGQPHDIDPSCNGLNMGSASLANIDSTQAIANYCWTISLDDILERLGSIDLLKLDCECAEFPILLTSRKLTPKTCGRIVGEYHEHPTDNLAWSEGIKEPFKRTSIGARLRKQGFKVKWKGEGPMGLFHAHA